jgi:hypothetical protein
MDQGGAIVTWGDLRIGYYDIYAQRISAAGTLLWNIEGVEIADPIGSHILSPQIVSDGSGGAIITWPDRRSGNYDIYAQRINSSGNVLWTVDGVSVCTATGDQRCPLIVSDGSGGAIIAWRDHRSGNWDIYAQRIDSDGDTLWTLDGVAVRDQAGSNVDTHQMAIDGYGGAVITWLDWGDINVYADRVSSSGSVQWGNVRVCTESSNQYDPQIICAGSGSYIITWFDIRSGYWDVYAQRMSSAGSRVWDDSGLPICTAPYSQAAPKIVTDGVQGAIICWMDGRNGSDLYAQRVDKDGDAYWEADGEPICIAPNGQMYPGIVSDGSGGAVITWMDYRSGVDTHIYAQRVDADGMTLWTPDGERICTNASNQMDPKIASDGWEGAIIAWKDNRAGGGPDIYAQRVDFQGFTLWTASGEPICTEVDRQEQQEIVEDGQGGAIITWEDYRGAGDSDIYAQRVDADANILWTTNGEAVCTAENSQMCPSIVSDGDGGAIIAWEDARGTHDNIYAQRIDADGDTLMPADGVRICTAVGSQNEPQLASHDSAMVVIAWDDWRDGNSDIYAQKASFNPAPRIFSISDVPDDQGRQVTILWYRSYLDDSEFDGISEYSIWRKYPGGSKTELSGVEWDGSLPKDLTQRVYRRIEREDGWGGSKTEFWEIVGTLDAHFLEGYAYTAPTLYDSSASGTAYFSFFVSAHTADPHTFWDSAPDSGYSVDNVNPAKTQMTVLASGNAKGSVNTVWLAWDQVTVGVDGTPEKGPIDYRIYCDESSDFTPGPGNLLTTTSNLSYPHTDARIGDPAVNLFYLVTAVDGGDNESAVSNLVGEFDRSLANLK